MNLLDSINAAGMALDEQRRDAERYRWLRQDAAAAGWKPPRCPNPCPDGIATCTTRHTHEVTGAALDDAIDAAMREQGANG